ncbi:MAG TPA: sugar nucleotide-binding protein [Pirellulaceae bacterium]
MRSEIRNPAPPLPLLITGVAGVAGYNAFHYFRRKFGKQVIGIRRKDNWPLKGEGIVACDGDDRDGLLRLFDKHPFAAVLNCEGTCKLKSCELAPKMAERVNIDSVTTILDVVRGRETRLVHLSIDLVFSGTRGGGHVEEDAIDPVTVYGKTMAIAEQIILRSPINHAILRISLPMGVSFNGHAGAIDWIQSRFKKDKPATLYYDEVRTPTYTDCMNPLLAEVLSRPEIIGLFHAGGRRRLSLFHIAQIVNRVGGYDPDLLHGCPRIEAGPMPPRAGDVTMDSSKLAAALGYDPFDPWPLDDDHVPTHRQWHYEGPRGSPELLSETLYRNPRRSNDQAPSIKSQTNSKSKIPMKN